jgi:hypothetical protein
MREWPLKWLCYRRAVDRTGAIKKHRTIRIALQKGGSIVLNLGVLMEMLKLLSNSLDVVWLIPVFFFIHEIEEWNILAWYKKYYANLPNSTNVSIRIHIFALSAIGFLVTILAYLSPIVIRSFLIIFFSGFILANTVQHSIQTFQHMAYAPGLVTALFCTAACTFANIMLIRMGMMFVPLYIMLLLAVPTILNTIKHKNELTREVRSVHKLFIHTESMLRRIWN